MLIVLGQVHQEGVARGDHADHRRDGQDQPRHPREPPAELPAAQHRQQSREAQGRPDSQQDGGAQLQLIVLGPGDGQGLPQAGDVLELEGVAADDDEIVIAQGDPQRHDGRQQPGQPGPSHQNEERQAEPKDQSQVDGGDPEIFPVAQPDLRVQIAVGEPQDEPGQHAAGQEHQKEVPEYKPKPFPFRHSFSQDQRRVLAFRFLLFFHLFAFFGLKLRNK